VAKKFDAEDWAKKHKDDAPEIRQLKSELSRLHRLLSKARAGESLIVEEVHSILDDDFFDIEIPARPRASRSKRGIEEAFLHISDVQIGKRTSSYSTQVASERLMMLAEKAVEIADTRRHSAKIESLHICLGGDLVEGETIFGGQQWSVDGDLWAQAIKLGPEMLARAILYLTGHFRHIHISSVPGNHGRSGSKYSGVSKKTNFDSITSEITRLIVDAAMAEKKRDGQITWDLDHGTFWTIHNLCGWGVLCVHGDQIRGGFAGFPYYGVGKRAWGWIDAIPDPWTYLAFGHFHTFAAGTLNKRYYLANGTVESDNEYAQEQLAATGDPCQRLAFFNRKNGMISDHQIWLGGKREADYKK